MAVDEPNKDLRDQAIRRLKKRRDLLVHVLVYALVNALLVVIWAVGSHGFFWPIFPILGWGILLVLNTWRVYQGDENEARIRKEMDRMRKPE